jgi:acyl-CoA thioester hydrolase
MGAVQQNITYKRELLSGDIVAVRSGMLEMRDKVAKFVHEMRNAQTGELSAVCVLTAVHMDGKARKSTAFPPEFVARGKNMLCSYEIEQ